MLHITMQMFYCLASTSRFNLTLMVGEDSITQVINEDENVFRGLYYIAPK